MIQAGPFTFWVPGPLPAQNEIIKSAKGHGGRGIGYSNLKFQWTTDIALIIRKARIPPMKRVRIRFDWVSVDKRHNPDNIEAGQKFVWDALQHEIAGVLKNDGWKQNAGSEHHHELGPKAGVRVTVMDASHAAQEGAPAAKELADLRQVVAEGCAALREWRAFGAPLAALDVGIREMHRRIIELQSDLTYAAELLGTAAPQHQASNGETAQALLRRISLDRSPIVREGAQLGLAAITTASVEPPPALPQTAHPALPGGGLGTITATPQEGSETP